MQKAGMEHPLRTYRQQKGLSLRDLARMAATSKTTISRIEGYYVDPSMALIRRLVTVTDGGIRADDFLSKPCQRK